MSTLASLWDFSLLLCAVALLAIAALLLARAVSGSNARQREDMRRKLLPAMLRGDAVTADSRLGRKVVAELTLELAELVRGSDRDALISSARSSGALRELRRGLRSHSSQNRLMAAEALALFPEYADELSATVFTDPDRTVRLGTALALAQEGHAPPVGQLVRGLGIGSTENSLLVVSLMRDLVKTDPHAVEALLYDLELPDAAKLAATDALAESGTVDHAPLVAWMAEAAGDDSDLQPRIFRALGRLGHPAGHDAIMAGMDNPVWQVRAAAAEAAGRSRLKSAADRIAELLDDDEWWVRFRAGEALSRLGSAGRLLLQRTALDDAPIARAAAKATMRERGLA